MEERQIDPGSHGREGLLLFYCFSSLREEERERRHLNREKETLPSMGWPRAHVHHVSHPKPPPSPPTLPLMADPSFLPNFGFPEPIFPRNFPSFFKHPTLILLCSSGQLIRPGMKCPPSTATPANPGIGKPFPAAQPPSMHATDPRASTPHSQHQKSISPTHRTIKRNTEAHSPLKPLTPP